MRLPKLEARNKMRLDIGRRRYCDAKAPLVGALLFIHSFVPSIPTVFLAP